MNPEHLDPLLAQPLLAFSVTPRAIPHVVTDAVDLDRDFRFSAVEVDNVPPERVLAAELYPRGLAAENPPQ